MHALGHAIDDDAPFHLSNINDTRYPDAVLLSAYVFESESYSERLEDYPVELYFTPKTSVS